MRHFRGAIILLAVAFFAAATTESATTTNLTAGGTISLATIIDFPGGLNVQIGDKNFADFFFSYIDSNGNPNDDLTKSNVLLTALMNDIGFGISLQQPFIAVGGDFKDIAFKYSVTVTDPNFHISDIHLSITGSAGNGGLGTVGEDAFIGGFGATKVGHLQASIPVATGDVAFANIVPTQDKLWVQKDIIATGGGAANGFASITIIDQTFSQVPEPSTVMLVGLGLLGLIAVRRKHKS